MVLDISIYTKFNILYFKKMLMVYRISLLVCALSSRLSMILKIYVNVYRLCVCLGGGGWVGDCMFVGGGGVYG